MTIYRGEHKYKNKTIQSHIKIKHKKNYQILYNDNIDELNKTEKIVRRLQNLDNLSEINKLQLKKEQNKIYRIQQYNRFLNLKLSRF